jgi:hypothetical protein
MVDEVTCKHCGAKNNIKGLVGMLRCGRIGCFKILGYWPVSLNK